MELNGKDVLSFVSHSFVCTIIYVDKCRFGNALFLKSFCIYHIAMVLWRNVNASCLKVFYRMVAAAVSVFHLMCVSACCKCHELMSKANCKDRYIRFVKFTDFFYNSSTFFRVSRSIAQHDSVRSIFQDLFCRCQCRIDCHLTSSFIQRMCDVTFCSKVHECYFWSVTFEYFFFFAGNFFNYFSCCICF